MSGNSHMKEEDVEVQSTTYSLDEYLQHEISQEEDHKIKYRTCSWQKTAFLLFSEYICLAILSFPWSFSVLGLIPGLILTVGIALIVLYTSLVLLDYCLKHPDLRDVCDIGQHLFWNKNWAWYFTAVCYLLNNTFIQGLHVLTGSRYLNAMSSHAICTVGFGAIMGVVCFFFSLPRTFSGLSSLALISAVATFVSVVLAMIFSGIQDVPAGFDGTPVKWNLWPEPGTSYVDGMNAMLNITYTLVGQIVLPALIWEMKDPREFKKVVWTVTMCEIVLYCIAGSIIYVYVGGYYITAPAFFSLDPLYLKIAFSFVVPTLIFLGVLYASVSARFIFLRIFPKNSPHIHEHTVLGWSVWAGILAATWIAAFIIAELIPFFSSLLSLMSSLFDCWFGFIFWGVAYLRVQSEEYGPGWWKHQTLWGYVKLGFNIFLIVAGFYILGPGTYATAEAIVQSYQAGGMPGPFTCKNNA
ncbi:hypothetical protein AWJ20_1557 [Sugiyamaella lignohabitans]|uniref:Amino acid transporter transmembrane domain-containing protein n=1 Tax=Sugiyamaella lignohabitans TaxID=796027 RepID=A0A161HX80_9ASCO|nr:uncharacterized protein AWJ20_1557 [Sugiyamaella lignohabitans]ANB13273.1 hypothetical protein AWJ20_1557 [Sugiyamaella lignohabitans]